MTSKKEQLYIRRIAELEAKLKRRDERISALGKQVAELMEQVGKLTDKVAKLSKNSSNGYSTINGETNSHMIQEKESAKNGGTFTTGSSAVILNPLPLPLIVRHSHREFKAQFLCRTGLGRSRPAECLMSRSAVSENWACGCSLTGKPYMMCVRVR